jgi:aryl-alcohol dehydrogenase-like predicted oxidoreductase
VTEAERRALGASEIRVSGLGVGTDSWGSKLLGYGKRFGDDDLYEAYRASLEAGIDFFDTAPGYGKGLSEELLGRFRKKDGRPILIATKYDNPTGIGPSLADSSAKPLPAALDASLTRLGVERVDLYLIHFPIPSKRVDEFADALAAAVESGKVRAVGVSNFNAPLMRAMHASLAARGVTLAANEVAFNLVNRKVETNGVLDACRELKIALIPYIPLAVGVLTGKYWAGGHKFTSFQRMFFRISELDPFHEQGSDRKRLPRRLAAKPEVLCDLDPLFTVMQSVGVAREKSLVQVALNWLLTADPLVIPIPGAKNGRQARENAGALGWRLTDEEREQIDRAERACRP